MASAPASFPPFYKGLEILSSERHADWRVRQRDRAPFLAGQHMVPVTVAEFPVVQRFMPIVFSSGQGGIPVGLMGLNEGCNVFVDDEGALRDNNFYVPSYVRRYPYMLVRLNAETDQLSLCFDPTSDAIGPFEEGEPLFENGQPSAAARAILEFNEAFEQSSQQTQAFVRELEEMDLLTDGEVTIQPDNGGQPQVYNGFRMINEDKLKELRGDQHRKMVRSGMLPLVYAHLFSLALMREIFGRQVQLGLTQAPAPASAPAPAVAGA